MGYNASFDAEGRGVLTLVHEGEVLTISDQHPNFLRIGEALLRGEDPARFLSVSASLNDALAELAGDRVTFVEPVEVPEWFDGVDQYGVTQVLFDGQPISGGIVDTILRYRDEGRNTDNLVRFLERLDANPSRHAREALFTWVENHGLTVNDDGLVVAFKGVYKVEADDVPVEGEYTSSSAGWAKVDGIEQGSRQAGVQIRQRIGSVVEVERRLVDDDHSTPCSVGLHVGSWEYASTFTDGTVLEVAFDPADVVSVPSSDLSWKLRVCRYTAIALHEPELADDLSHHEPEAVEPDPFELEHLAAEVPQTWLDRIFPVGRKRRRFEPGN